jgi:hypothetical protein
VPQLCSSQQLVMVRLYTHEVTPKHASQLPRKPIEVIVSLHRVPDKVQRKCPSVVTAPWLSQLGFVALALTVGAMFASHGDLVVAEPIWHSRYTHAEPVKQEGRQSREARPPEDGRAGGPTSWIVGNPAVCYGECPCQSVSLSGV